MFKVASVALLIALAACQAVSANAETAEVEVGSPSQLQCNVRIISVLYVRLYSPASSFLRIPSVLYRKRILARFVNRCAVPVARHLCDWQTSIKNYYFGSYYFKIDNSTKPFKMQFDNCKVRLGA